MRSKRSEVFQTTERAQRVRFIVETWADGCEKTVHGNKHDPEDCEECTERMLNRVNDAAGLSEKQRTDLRVYLAQAGVYQLAEGLIEVLMPNLKEKDPDDCTTEGEE